jgi:hypothetical protein
LCFITTIRFSVADPSYTFVILSERSESKDLVSLHQRSGEVPRLRSG